MSYNEIGVFIIIALLFQVRNILQEGDLGYSPCYPQILEKQPAVSPESTPAVQMKSEKLILTNGDTSDWGGYFSGSSEHVVHLFEPTIQPYIASRTKWLFIMFYIPSCEYSSLAKQEFASAAQEMHEKAGGDFIFASVNCDANVETCKAQNIDGYPTFFLFYDGKYLEEYVDQRLKQNFVSYAQNPPKPGFFSRWF